MDITFNTDRVTKNTVRFAEATPDGEAAKMGTVYVSKHVLKALGVANPDNTKSVTLELKAAT